MARTIFQGIFFPSLLIFCWTVPAWAAPASTAIDKVLARHPKLEKTRMGLSILDAKTGKPVFAKNAELPLNPASSLKVLVSAAALDRLGVGHVFRTSVRRTQNVLCLVGGGDPAMVQESLRELAEITATFLRPGDLPKTLILDETLFTGEKPFDASFDGDSDRAFTADIGSLSTSFNSVALRIAPTELGKPGKVMLSPDLEEIQVVNRTVTAAEGNKKSLAVDLRKTDRGYRIDVSGKVNAKKDFFTLFASLPSDPAAFTGLIFSRALRQNGVPIESTRAGACPAQAATVFEWESKPLAAIVGDMNVYSNNFIAEMLLRALSPDHGKAGGLAVLQDWLNRAGLADPSIRLENASGLSRVNRISARALAAIFRHAMGQPAFGPEFLASMSLNGATGTMKSRMRDPSKKTIIRAKSGTLSNAVSLVGRAQREDGDFVFAFMFNDSPYAAYQLQSIESEILDALLDSR